MLHLALAGNLLSSLGGSLELYDFQVIPQYPGYILYDAVEMSLDRANKENLERFTNVRLRSCLGPGSYVDIFQ